MPWVNMNNVKAVEEKQNSTKAKKEYQDEEINIIVVDDEPVSADDMGDLLTNAFEGENVNVHVAYSGAAVLKLAKEKKCDILLSDIQMPGMTGLSLSEKVRNDNPEVQVLFLTGFDDFNYAYEAFKQNASHYLLKTEGDSVIVKAVKEEVEKLREKRSIQKNIAEAESKFAQLVPALKHQTISELLMNPVTAEELEASGMLEMFPGSIFMVVAKMVASKSNGESKSVPIKTKLVILSSVEKMITSSLSENILWYETAVIGDDLVWLVSVNSAQDNSDTYTGDLTGTLFQLSRKARGQIEEKLSADSFFVVSDEGVSIENLCEKFDDIRSMLNFQILRGAAGVAVKHSLSSPDNDSSEDFVKTTSLMRKQVELCRNACTTGDTEQLKNHAKPVVDFIRRHDNTISGSESDYNLCVMEFSTAMTGMLLETINRGEIASGRISEKNLPHDNAARIEALIAAVCENDKAQMDFAMRSITQFVLDYIRDHISEDISASALAEASGYSSGYLSRVFKQQQGVSVHDYVIMTRMNLAREMLCNTNLRVYEISSACGYENTAYFIKVFKQETGMTPQEFKEDAIKRGRARQ